MKTATTPLVGLVALFAAQPAWAADYYASPDGSGSTCSESSPCSISNAVGAAGAGDTVYLMDGVYEAPSYGFGIGSSGTADAWLTIKAAPGAVPVIQGPGSGDTTGINISGTYVRIEGVVSTGFASGFANQWGGPNGNLEFVHCVAENLGRNGIAFYDASGVLVEGCIVAHTGHDQGWSSGVNMFGASNAIVRRTVSFETIDASGEGTDGSGFIADQYSDGVVFENNVGFRNGGSCIRLTNSPGSKIINNTCVHNGLDPNVSYHDEIFFSQAAARDGALLRNNLTIPTSGQRGLAMGDGVPDENNIWDGTDDLVVSATAALDFNLSASAAAAIDQGTSTGAPADDIGFDWQCIKQESGQRYDWWQYMPDLDYMRSIGGVAACFQANARSGNPDIGAHESGSTPVGTGGVGTGGATTGGVDAGGVTTGGVGAGGAITGGVGAGGATTGGVGDTGGLATGGMATGGMATGGLATGGADSTGGVGNTGGTDATGAVSATGGVGAVGGTATGGTAASAPSGTGASSVVATGGDGTMPSNETSEQDAGCSCQLPGARGHREAWALLLGAAIMTVFGRRRRTRRATRHPSL